MENWLLLRSPPASASINMAVDETLLRRVQNLEAPVLRLYSWTDSAASFGYFQKFDDVASLTPLRPLVRRPTGGGIVPHANDWTYSLAFAPSHPWYRLRALESYRQVHDWVREAFADIGYDAELATKSRADVPGQCFAGAERFDVLFQDRKIAGAAQRRTRDGLLIQGSVQPPPRASRSDWEQALERVAAQRWGVRFASWELPPDFARDAARLAADKYSSAAYTGRR